MSLGASLLLLSSIRALAVFNPAIVSAAPAGEDAAAYVVIYNLGSGDDRLVEVSCACAERIEIHAMVGSGAERRMEIEPGLALPRDRLVEIQPGGARHLMLMGLREPLVAGRTVSLTFRFERGGHQAREVTVVADTRAGWTAALAQGRPSRPTARCSG